MGGSGSKLGGVLVAVAIGAAPLIGLAVVAPPAGATTFAVTSGADDGSPGTLRWAVAEAAAAPGDDVVTVDPAVGTITLADCGAGRIDVGGDGTLTIDGGGATVRQTCPAGVLGTAEPASIVLRDVTVTGGESADGAGVDVPAGSVTLDRATVSGNAAADVGGGVRAATLRSTDSTIRDNQARAGGGVAVTSGPLEIVGGTIEGNRAAAGLVPTVDPPEGYGGGVAVLGAGPARITGTTLQQNEAGLGGGAVFSESSLVLEDVAVVDNTAVYGGFGRTAAGGGIATTEQPLTIPGSRIQGNRSSYAGGLTAGGPVEVQDTAIEGNQAALGYGGGRVSSLVVTGTSIAGNRTNAGPAGGLHVDGELVMARAAVVGNESGGFGGGLSLGGAAVVRSSTIVGNAAPVAPAIASSASLRLELATVDGNVGDPGAAGAAVRTFGSALGAGACASLGSVTSEGYNVAGGADCGLSEATDVADVGDLGLGPLGLNGGPTPNRVPASGSPLLNRIPADDARCSGTDQRGVARPQNGACDAGAVEVREVSATGTSVSTAAGVAMVVDLHPLVSDPDGVLTTYGVTDVVGGSASGAAGGVVTYTPAPGFGGPGRFTFVVCSAGDVVCTDPATVQVSVAAGAATPVAAAPTFAG